MTTFLWVAGWVFIGGAVAALVIPPLLGARMHSKGSHAAETGTARVGKKPWRSPAALWLTALGLCALLLSEFAHGLDRVPWVHVFGWLFLAIAAVSLGMALVVWRTGRFVSFIGGESAAQAALRLVVPALVAASSGIPLSLRPAHGAEPSTLVAVGLACSAMTVAVIALSHRLAGKPGRGFVMFSAWMAAIWLVAIAFIVQGLARWLLIGVACATVPGIIVAWVRSSRRPNPA
jgi:hypothetical protein